MALLLSALEHLLVLILYLAPLLQPVVAVVGQLIQTPD